MEFPKRIFVAVRDDETDEPYLSVADNTTTAEQALSYFAEAEPSKKIRIATYQLVEVKEGKLEPVFSVIVG